MTDNFKQHTPGPWAFEYSNDVGPDDEYFIEFFEIRAPGYVKVAEVDNEVDARLIAAAPTMLETLKRLQEMCADFGAHTACEVAEAAITLATERSK